jgi:ubiquinone/menaquinone biosynthesis C-methylase UbiE
MNKKYAKFLLEKTKDDYNAFAERFSSARKNSWKEMKFLFNYLKSGDKALDLGCGNGRFFEEIEEKGADYAGVDNSEKLIEIAKNRYSDAKFFVGNALNLPFSDNCFDKVYAIAFLHHIPSQKFRIAILKEIRRVLKQNGILVLTVWNLWRKPKTWRLIFKFTILKILGKSKLDFRDIFLPWYDRKDCYFHCFTIKELKKLICQAGFEVIEKGKIPLRSNSNLYLVCFVKKN